MPLLLAIRFIAEIGMLVCLAWGGWSLGPQGLGALTLAIGLPVAAALVWSQWVAPRAPRRLQDPYRLWVEVSLFTAALMVVAQASDRPAILLGILTWTAFLVSMSARTCEPTPPRT